MSTENRKVVIAMDGSYHSDFAFDWYLKNFRRQNDNVVLVHCMERHESFHTAMGTADIQAVCSIIEEEEKQNQALKENLEKKLTSNNLQGSVKTKFGKPGEFIVAVSKEVGADSIICGSRGHGKIRRTVLGAVSDYIVHHSDVPVTVCRHTQLNSSIHKT